MKREFSVHLRLALPIAAAACMAGTAVAQQATTTTEVRVQAAGVIKREAGKTSTGVPIETAEITMRVDYGDLSLNTNSGQALLRDRVAAAAKDACARISSTYALGTPGTSDAECVNSAINSAKSQVDAAITAANGRKAAAR